MLMLEVRTSDGHRVALRPAAVAPAVFYAAASEHGAQPRLMLPIYHLGFFISAGHCNERQAGLLGRNSPKLMAHPRLTRTVLPHSLDNPSFILLALHWKTTST